MPRDRQGIEAAFLSSIAHDGVLPEALAEARRLLSKLLARLPEPVLRNMFADRITLVLVPGDKRILDMPQAAYVVAQSKEFPTTNDGRRWETVDNLSNVPMPCGGFAWFVNERSVLGTAMPANRKGFTVVHEFSHMVEKHGFSMAQTQTLTRIYAGYYAVSNIDREIGPDLYYPFPEIYAVERSEFFPQMTNVWLDAYQIAPGGGDQSHRPRGPAWFDYVPAWLPPGPGFVSHDRYLKEDFAGNLDDILGKSRKHEPLGDFLRSIWGGRASILSD